jgi:hypothetical protein
MMVCYYIGHKGSEKNRRLVQNYIMKNFKVYALYRMLNADPVNEDAMYSISCLKRIDERCIQNLEQKT